MFKELFVIFGFVESAKPPPPLKYLTQPVLQARTVLMMMMVMMVMMVMMFTLKLMTEVRRLAR